MSKEEIPGPQPPRQGGIDADRDVQAGRDIAGRDIRNITVGLGENALVRLVLIVGLLVFFSTACSFTAGAVAMAGIMNTLQQPVNLSVEAANEMELKLDQLTALPPGEPFEVVFSETELNSYFHYRVAERMGLQNGEARLVGSDQVAVTGSLDSAGGMNVMAVFDVQEGSKETLNLSSAAVQIFDSGGSLGWASVPTFFLQDLEDQANESLGGSFIIQRLEVVPVDFPDVPGSEQGWLLNGIGGE